MKTVNAPRRLAAEEFEQMMSELDLASDWMREQLALRHARSATRREDAALTIPVSEHRKFADALLR